MICATTNNVQCLDMAYNICTHDIRGEEKLEHHLVQVPSLQSQETSHDLSPRDTTISPLLHKLILGSISLEYEAMNRLWCFSSTSCWKSMTVSFTNFGLSLLISFPQNRNDISICSKFYKYAQINYADDLNYFSLHERKRRLLQNRHNIVTTKKSKQTYGECKLYPTQEKL